MQPKAYEKLENLQDTSSQITISVKEAEVDQTGNFTTYLILGQDKMGSYEIRRRFNDFFLLRQALIRNWPGCYIPPIPSKKATGNKEERFIEYRRRFLEYFCRKVAGLRYLYFSEPFQLFIRNKSFTMETLQQSHYNVQQQDIINNYGALFNTYQSKDTQHDLKSKATTFYTYLTKSEKELRELKGVARELATAQQNFNQNFMVMSSILLPEYEKQVFTEYMTQHHCNLIFLNDNWTGEKIRAFRDNIVANPFDFIVDLVAFELRQVMAMKEAIQVRDQYEQKKRKLEDKKKDEQYELSKLMSGKTTFKSIFTRGNKNQQISALEKQIMDDQTEIQNIAVMVDFISLILVHEIENFKKYKLNQYKETLEVFTREESKQMGIYGDVMRAIMQAAKVLGEVE